MSGLQMGIRFILTLNIAPGTENCGPQLWIRVTRGNHMDCMYERCSHVFIAGLHCMENRKLLPKFCTKLLS